MMKKILLFILILSSIAGYSQQWKQYSDRKKGQFYADSFYVAALQKLTDTSANKVLVIDSRNKVHKMYWPTSSGEANTASNLGGGLANYSTKSGVDLQFNSFASSDFDLASNLISIDATLKSTWNGKIGGSGTANQVAIFDGTSSITSSNIYYSANSGDPLFGFNVNPSGAKLQIESSSSTDYLRATRTGSTKFSITSTGQIYSADLDDAASTEHPLVVNNGIVIKQDRKRVADGNYTVAVTDAYLMLPDPAATRTLTLPAASTMKGHRVVIDCRSTSVGEWVLSGSFIQAGSTSTTEDFVNSGLGAGTKYDLTSIDMGSGTWKWVAQ